jgi:conserved repeat domain
MNSGSVYLTDGHTYTLKVLDPPLGAAMSCPSNGMITVSMPPPASANNVISVDFGYTCNPTSNFDLQVTGRGYYRPWANSSINIWALNKSCSPHNAVLTVQVSNQYTISSTYPTANSINGNTATFNINNISNHSAPQVSLSLLPAASNTLSVGDNICFTATITPTTGDINPTNNTLVRCDTVIGSYDPNDKQVSPAGPIMNGEKLDYVINFENLGNDTAFNIYILDTLSDKLDVKSFMFQSASHKSNFNIENVNGKNILKCYFPDIHLPDSNSKEYNKGFIKFSINAKSGLTPLTEITNRAGIYFDYNEVVMTNTTNNWIRPLGVDDNLSDKNKRFLIYPNPAESSVTIKTDPALYDAVKFINSMGQLVISRPIEKTETNIDIKSLAPGIYYLQLSGVNGTAADMLEIQ